MSAWRNGNRLFEGYGRTEKLGVQHTIVLYVATTLRDTTTHYLPQQLGHADSREMQFQQYLKSCQNQLTFQKRLGVESGGVVTIPELITYYQFVG